MIAQVRDVMLGMEQASAAMLDLPLYRSHKLVHAARLVAIQPLPAGQGGVVLTVEADDGTRAIFVTDAWFTHHAPGLGAYLVRYEDGYLSVSPAKALEEGYTRA